MLVLSRKLGEKIVIGDNIVVTVVKIDRNQIRIGIEAPHDVPVYREEIAPQRADEVRRIRGGRPEPVSRTRADEGASSEADRGLSPHLAACGSAIRRPRDRPGRCRRSSSLARPDDLASRISLATVHRIVPTSRDREACVVSRMRATGAMPALVPLGADSGKHQNRTSNLEASWATGREAAGCRSRPRVAIPSRVRDRRVMLATWIETAAKGRHGGPVRAGMWSAVVIGSHPIQDSQRVWLEVIGRRSAISASCRPTGSRTRRATASGMRRSRRRASAPGSITARSSSGRAASGASAPTRIRSSAPTCPTGPNPSDRRCSRPRGWSATG